MSKLPDFVKERINQIIRRTGKDAVEIRRDFQVNYRTGKGGHHGVYSSPMDEEGFKRYVTKNIIAKLFETWPDATKEVVEEIFR